MPLPLQTLRAVTCLPPSKDTRRKDTRPKDIRHREVSNRCIINNRDIRRRVMCSSRSRAVVVPEVFVLVC